MAVEGAPVAGNYHDQYHGQCHGQCHYSTANQEDESQKRRNQ